MADAAGELALAAGLGVESGGSDAGASDAGGSDAGGATGRVEVGEDSARRVAAGGVGVSGGEVSVDGDPAGLADVVVRVGAGEAGTDRSGVRVGLLVASGGSGERVGAGGALVRLGASIVREAVGRATVGPGPVGTATVGRVPLAEGRAVGSGSPCPPQDDRRTDAARAVVTPSAVTR